MDGVKKTVQPGSNELKQLAGVAFKRHNLRKRSQKMKRKARGTMVLSDADARIVKSYMPYA